MASQEITETGWTLFIAVPQSYVLDGVIQLMQSVALFWFPGIILVVALIWFGVSRLISKPINTMGEFASKVSTGRYALASVTKGCIGVHSNDEVGELARTLEKSYIQLNESRLKSNFLANISHEMKTPLTIISGYAKLVKWDIADGTVTEETINQLTEISEESHRLAELVSKVLKTSAAHGEAETFICVNPKDLIEKTAALCDSVLLSADNRLIIDVEDNCPEVTANPEMIIQTLENLIVNANRHSNNGVIELRVENGEWRIERDGERPFAGFVLFTVRDYGDGIAPELLGEVFKRGYSGDGSSGLGLAICKETIESHGGGIRIENGELGMENGGRGVVVSFTLPVWRGAD